MKEKTNPGRIDLVSSLEAGWGQPQNSSLFLRWSKGSRVREEEGTGHSTGIIKPANRVGGQVGAHWGLNEELGRGPCKDSPMGQLVSGKEGES